MESLLERLVEFAEASFRGEAEDEPPKQLSHIWEQFLEVNAWRGINTDTGLPQTMTVDLISSWATATDNEISDFALYVFSRLEAAYWAAQNPKAKPGSLTAQFSALKTPVDKTPIKTIPMNPGKKK